MGSMNEDNASKMAQILGNDQSKKLIQSVLASTEGQELLKLLSQDPHKLDGVKTAILKNDTQGAKAGLEDILTGTSGEQALRSLLEKLKE